MNSVIERALRQLSVGERRETGSLKIWPLAVFTGLALDFLTLYSALASCAVEITKDLESEIVPSVMLQNFSASLVLILDGDKLIGCKQNRIIDATILVPLHSDLVSPVSRVEVGRLGSLSASFCGSSSMLFASARTLKAGMMKRTGYDRHHQSSLQHAIWNDINLKTKQMGSSSRSSAMSGIYARSSDEIDYYVPETVAVLGRIGTVVVFDAKPLGVELFNSPALYTNYQEKLVRAHAVDVIGYHNRGHHSNQCSAQNANDLKKFLGAFMGLEIRESCRVGLGLELRLKGCSLSAAALTHGEAVIQFSGSVVNSIRDLLSDEMASGLEANHRTLRHYQYV